MQESIVESMKKTKEEIFDQDSQMEIPSIWMSELPLDIRDREDMNVDL